jgi:hypothetical protein
MLNGRTVSLDLIIEHLIQDYGFETVNKAEVAEWVWRSMEIIGTPYPYEDIPVELEIVDYRAKLPVNLYSIGMVRDKITGIPLREMTNMFNKFGDSVYEGVTEVEVDTDPATGTVYSTIVGPDASSEYYTFKTQGNFIYFGMETGTIEMQYKAIPIDVVSGMPTIPDNAKYIRGVVSFIAERMAFRMYLKDMLSKDKFETIRQDYFFNVGAAQSVCNLPDASRMETLINRWKSTYLGPDHFDTGFIHLGSRE